MTKMKKQGCPTHSADAVREWRRRNVTGYCRPSEPPRPPPPEAAPPPVDVDVERLDLAQERALLIRAQRQEVEGRLRLAAGEFTPQISLLAQVLADAGAAVSRAPGIRLPARIKRACPLLPARALDEVQAVVATARNEWVRATCKLVAAKIDSIDDGDEPEPT